MAADFKIVSPMFDELTTLIQTSVAGNFKIMMEYTAPLFGAAAILYVVWLAWEIIYTGKTDIMMESVKTIGLFTLVCTLMTAGGMYLTDIVPFVQNSGQEIAGKIIGTDGTTTGATIDGLVNTLLDMCHKFWQEFERAGGFTSKLIAFLMMIAKGAVLLFCGLGFVLICAAYLLMAEMMVGILLSMGGLFIAFAAFPPTRQMFTAWVGSCLNYIFLNIAYACLFKIMMDYITKHIHTGSSGGQAVLDNFWSVVSIAMLFVIAKFLMAQISTLISTLTGGVGINGLTSAVSNAMNSVRGGIKNSFRAGNAQTGDKGGMGRRATVATGRGLMATGRAAGRLIGVGRGGGNIKGG